VRYPVLKISILCVQFFTHAVFDVVVDDEAQFLVRKAIIINADYQFPPPSAFAKAQITLRYSSRQLDLNSTFCDSTDFKAIFPFAPYFKFQIFLSL